MLPYECSPLSPSIALPDLWSRALAVRAPLRIVRRLGEVFWEAGTAALMDRLAPQRSEIIEASEGCAPSAPSIVIYAHWSPNGCISRMVYRQLRFWREAGFACVFITSSNPPAEDWGAVAADTALRIRRTNAGRDFGAWRDAAVLVQQHFGIPEELLLANDSVVGPFFPLRPIVDALRAHGDGLFGLTESLGRGAHLQSYALLGRGKKAVAEMLVHLASLKISRSKWQLVQRGEIGLSERMMRAGVPCWALFGQERLAALASATTRKRIAPRHSGPEAFARVPFNPCHHLWQELVECMGYPFLKTDLICRNPGKLPGVENWRRIVPAEELPIIDEHLTIMSSQRPSENFSNPSRQM